MKEVIGTINTSPDGYPRLSVSCPFCGGVHFHNWSKGDKHKEVVYMPHCRESNKQPYLIKIHSEGFSLGEYI